MHIAPKIDAIFIFLILFGFHIHGERVVRLNSSYVHLFSLHSDRCLFIYFLLVFGIPCL